MALLTSSRSRAIASLTVPAALCAAALLSDACSGGGGGGGGGSGASAGPHPDFAATPTLGQRPLSVQFTDASTGVATDWLWDFGDGGSSIDRDPVHVYTHPGSFDVKLTLTGPGGVASKLRPDFIGATAPLLDAGLEAQTAGAPPGAPWDAFFGPQGNVGLVMNSLAGGADASMPSEGQLWADLGGDSTNDCLPPAAGPGPTPRTGAGIAQEFTFPAGQSVLQLDVVFVNGEAIGAPLTNDWMSVDVSDGVTTQTLLRRDTFSPTANHSNLHGGHRTTALETVTAKLQELFPDSNFLTPFTLTVQVGNAGNGSLPSQAYVDHLRFEVPQPPLDAQFNANPTQIVQGSPVDFFDQTLGATAWVWDFGDGKGSNLQNPVHAYTIPGVYDVKLHVTAPGTQGELVRQDLITVLAPTGTVAFDGQPTPVAVNSPVLFTNLSNGNFNGTWLWEFGDGQTSTAPGFNPRISHGYSTTGFKSVRLTGILINGQPLSLFKPNYIDVQTPVSISSHPQSVTVNEGQVANFAVVANGTAPLGFEWRKNGLTIPGAPNSPNFQTPPSTPGDNGAKFRVLVSNAVSSLLSNEATLTVILKPVILTHPQPVAVPPGGQAVFTVTLAQGTPPLTFVWRKNGLDLNPPAPNLPSLTINNVTLANDGERYSVRITNSAGQVISNEALLTVTTAPTIPAGGQPVSQTVCSGSPATFTVTANGTPTLHYQWKKNGTLNVGTDSPTFQIPAASSADAASYHCRVTNSFGFVDSQSATLTVLTNPAILPGGQPASTTICSGNQAQFTVTASGGGLGFQWKKNGTINVGTNSPTLTISNATTANAGQYSCVVSNNCNSVTSSSATLTVNVPPTITVQPVGTLFVCETRSKEFSVSATGTAPLSFQWKKNGAIIPGATSSSFTTPAATFADDGAQFTCTVSNSCLPSGVTSSAGVLQVAKKWSTIWTASISTKCVGCHTTATSSNAFLVLAGSASIAHGNTVGQGTGGANTCAGNFRIDGGLTGDPLHNQGNPANSILFNIQTGAFSGCMTQNHTTIGTPLTATERDEIRECILAGIPDI